MRILVAALIALTSARAAAQEGASTTTEGDAPEEAESHTLQPLGPALLYTRELTDQDLARKFRDDPASLGSVSVGFADRGRLLNAVQMPRDPAWIVERPELSFATRETVDALALAFRAVRREFPGSAPGRLSHVAARDGGYLRPHRSHQNGRDADVGFYYRNDRIPPRGVSREKLMDPARNWALIHALVTETDVQMILVDRKIQAVLRKYALSIGEDARWLS
ncbi:MAG: peptidoglycan-binding protein, partial [Myxococcales bacterium]